MLDALNGYFAAEKSAGVLLLAIAVAAFVLAWSVRGHATLAMMAWPLGVIGLAQIAVGATLVVRTDGQTAELRRKLATEPAVFAREESARMEKVQRSFLVLEVVEVALIAAGIVMALFFKERPAVWSAGLGILLQAAAMLVFDVVAEQRGVQYWKALRALGESAGRVI